MSQSFTEKKIKVTFILATGQFGDAANSGIGNTKVITELRVLCNVDKNGHPSKNCLKMKIYGMLASDMNKLTAATFRPLAVRKNLVRVEAGDVNGYGVVFEGEISGAWISYHSPPDLYFHVEALAGFFPAIKPVAPNSYNGATDVGTIMKKLSAQMGYRFENNGVSILLNSPYLSGTAYQQAAAVAAAANIEFGIDDGVLSIAPRGKPRKTGTAPLISALTGMYEYPEFSKKGIRVKTLYNPAVQLNGLVNVVSSAAQATGTWRVTQLRHHLESKHPGGKWLTTITATPAGA